MNRYFRVASTNCRPMTFARGHGTYLTPVECWWRDPQGWQVWRDWWRERKWRRRALSKLQRLLPALHSP